MTDSIPLPARLAALLVYSRPVLVSVGMICALAVMWSKNPVVYTVGVSFLVLSMILDLVDGWFSARFRPNAPLAPLADRLMDKLVYSIIFPVISAGMMWRLLESETDPTHGQLMHAIFVLVLCVTVLVRDSFASFMRGFAIRQGVKPENSEYNRMRTIVAAPVSALLYAYAFYIPEGPESWIYFRYLLHGKRFPAGPVFCGDPVFCHQPGVHCRILQKIRYRLPGRTVLRGPGAPAQDPVGVSQRPDGDECLHGIDRRFFCLPGPHPGILSDADRGGDLRQARRGPGPPAGADGAASRPTPQEKNINLGSIMDDLADAISFCIVPAWIFYIALSQFGRRPLRPSAHGLDRGISTR